MSDETPDAGNDTKEQHGNGYPAINATAGLLHDEGEEEKANGTDDVHHGMAGNVVSSSCASARILSEACIQVTVTPNVQSFAENECIPAGQCTPEEKPSQKHACRTAA